LVGLVAWQVQRWLAVRRALDAGEHAAAIGGRLGMKPWQVERLTREVAVRPLPLLQRHLERCWELGRDAKSGRAPADQAVEQLVIELTMPAGSAAA
jgi:DNA polymerase III delta subunit